MRLRIFTLAAALMASALPALPHGVDQQASHDFLLAQGFLPPDVMRRAVMEGFVGRKG